MSKTIAFEIDLGNDESITKFDDGSISHSIRGEFASVEDYAQRDGDSDAILTALRTGLPVADEDTAADYERWVEENTERD